MGTSVRVRSEDVRLRHNERSDTERGAKSDSVNDTYVVLVGFVWYSPTNNINGTNTAEVNIPSISAEGNGFESSPIQKAVR